MLPVSGTIPFVGANDTNVYCLDGELAVPVYMRSCSRVCVPCSATFCPCVRLVIFFATHPPSPPPPASTSRPRSHHGQREVVLQWRTGQRAGHACGAWLHAAPCLSPPLPLPVHTGMHVLVPGARCPVPGALLWPPHPLPCSRTRAHSHPRCVHPCPALPLGRGGGQLVFGPAFKCVPPLPGPPTTPLPPHTGGRGQRAVLCQR